MAWHRAGTITVTNGSTTVTGSGTGFIAIQPIGQGLLAPDGRIYEITNVASDTLLTISPAYLGSTASGQSYAIAPFRGGIADLIIETQSLLASFATVRDGIGAGLFPDGSAATPAFRFSGDQDTGIYRAGSNILGFATGGVGRAFIDGSGNMGVGVAAPGARLDVQSASSSILRLFNTGGTGVRIDALDQSFAGRLEMNAGDWIFTAGASEVMRLLNSGNVGIGTASPSASLDVVTNSAAGGISLRGRQSDNVSDISLKSNNGSSVYGQIQGRSSDLRFQTTTATPITFLTNSVERLRIESGGNVIAGVDNTQSLGGASNRWSVVYAGTGTINTSDEREKHWRGELNVAELRAAKRIIGELGIYQWNDAVAEKSEDGARLHFGVRAQRAFAIMEDEGLDWGRYAWACYDQWEEQTEPVMEEVTVTKTRKVMRPSTLIDPATGQPAMVEVDEAYEETEMRPTGETRVTLEAGDRYGVRPDQLAFWLIAAQAAIQADLEARLVALEAA